MVSRRVGEFTLGTLHQSCLLPEEHVVNLDGIRVTRPARMLFNLAADLSFKRLERGANTALAKKLTTVVELRRMLAKLLGSFQVALIAPFVRCVSLAKCGARPRIGQ